MQITLAAEQEAQLSQLAAQEGTRAEELARELFTRYLAEEARFIAAVKFGEAALQRGEYLTARACRRAPPPVNYGKSWPMEGTPNDRYFTDYHYLRVPRMSAPRKAKSCISRSIDTRYEKETPQKIYREMKALGGKWGERLANTVLFSSQYDAVLLKAADLLAHSIGQGIKAEDRGHKRSPNSTEQANLVPLGYFCLMLPKEARMPSISDRKSHNRKSS